MGRLGGYGYKNQKDQLIYHFAQLVLGDSSSDRGEIILVLRVQKPYRIDRVEQMAKDMIHHITH